MKVLRRRALCIEQTKSGPLYLFTLRADEIFEVAEVTRINRSRSNELIGYQRAEVRQHVEDILEYLNGDDVSVPELADPRPVSQRPVPPQPGPGERRRAGEGRHPGDPAPGRRSPAAGVDRRRPAAGARSVEGRAS